MTALGILGLIKTLGAAAGGILSIIALFTMCLKRPRKWITNIVKEVIKENYKEIKEEFNKIHDANSLAEKTSLNILRHNITTIYEQYKINKKIPSRIKEDLCILYEDYSSRGGNSYIHTIMDEMMEWEVI